MARKRFPDRIKDWSTDQRIDHAKKIINKLTYLVSDLVALHENNQIIVHSDVLSGQITKSFAANAFNLFQQTMQKQELLQLSSLWDRADENNQSILTAIVLVDDEAVITQLMDVVRSDWPRETIFPEEQAQKAKLELGIAIEYCHEHMNSELHRSLKNLRDKVLAHSLSATREEQKVDVIPLKHGDEVGLLEKSIDVVETLYCWVNGSSLDIGGNTRSIHRKNAEKLWGNCEFKIEKIGHSQKYK